MDEQTILACDDSGNFLEYIPKSVGHTGQGRRHLAITVLLYNKDGEVLLQRRKHKVFDNIWCFTGDTHLLHTKIGDETFDHATQRCLRVEYGITEKIPFKNLGMFNYFEKIGSLCENEHCAMMVGEYNNGEVNLNPSVGYEYQWVEKRQALADMETNPQKYAPWVIEGLKVLKQSGFFN